MGESKFILVGVGIAAVVIGVLYYGAKKIGNGIAGVIPDVVKEGAQATGVLTSALAGIVADPLDGFGVKPGLDASGNPKWQQTTPDASDDPVSNNDSGINFNYF